MFQSASRRVLLLLVQQDVPLLPAATSFLRLFGSKPHNKKGPKTTTSNSSKDKHKKHNKLQQEAAVDKAWQQQHPHPPASSHSPSLPQPAALVLPKLPAVPSLGRVPPSSSAATAAAAAILKQASSSTGSSSSSMPPSAAATFMDEAGGEATKHKTGGRPIKRRRGRQRVNATQLPQADAAERPPAAAIDHPHHSPSANQQQQQQDSDSDDEDVAASFQHLVPRQRVLPWEVVDHLQQSSGPFSLEAMAQGGINTYIAYLQAARMGMPSVFDLGIVREQGRQARRHLLQRERLLEAVVQEVYKDSSSSLMGQLDLFQQQQQQQEQQQQQQQHGISQAAAALSPLNRWQPSDAQLQELSNVQLEAAAAAAQASGNPLLANVTADDVAECLVDYYVFKRCMETLLLQRQHRHALKAKHHQLLHQQQQQQQQQPQQANSATPAFTLLSQEELAEVKIWDAFVDATLRDYLHYLEAAAAGQPSVFTTSSAALSPTGDRDSKDMQQTTAEYQDACQAMAMAADMLSWLPKQLMSRPGHLTKEQLVRLALVVQDDSTDNIVQILKHFHEVKRKAFVDVLEELLTAAGAAAAQTRGRF